MSVRKEETLSFEDKYDLKIDLTVASFSCEYAGCGTHAMALTMVTDLEDLKHLYKQLSKLKGVKET